MSAICGESPAGEPDGNLTQENVAISTRPVDWYIPWTDYAVEQAHIAQKTIESTLAKAIEVTRSRVDRILSTSSMHLNQTMDSFQDLKSDYITYEDLVFGKIKGGPDNSCPTRRGISFLAKSALLSRADAKVKELRQSIDLLMAESEKLEKMALQAEEDLVRGRTKLRQAGKQIQGVINSAHKIERQANDVLRELPSIEASRFRTQVTGLAKEVKKERNAMFKEVTKISNYGISV
ncbi:hypothetical protein OROGR_021047 [Orobanche gracilis]